MDDTNLYLPIPEMTNNEYREELQKLFLKIDNNLVLRYFFTMCYRLEKEWNIKP